MKSRTLLILALPGILFPSQSRAEEAGSGHYLPGATASFIDVLPGRETLAYVNAFTYYNGSIGGNRTLEFGGNLALNINGTVYADTSILLYQTPWTFLGGRYAAAAAFPYVWMEVTGDVQRTGPLGGVQTVHQRDSANGIGDIQILPFMMGWTNGDLKFGTSLGIYTPTGDFEKGRLANIGKNFWTFEPGVNASWLSSKIGLELTAFAGFDISTKNDKTDYQSGDVFHLDGTVAEHLPLLGGFVGVGANAFYYQQITGDSGSGALLGSLEGHTVGVGPVVSYVTKLGQKNDLAFEVKWLPELNVEHRLKGDLVWVKLALSF